MNKLKIPENLCTVANVTAVNFGFNAGLFVVFGCHTPLERLQSVFMNNADSAAAEPRAGHTAPDDPSDVACDVGK